MFERAERIRDLGQERFISDAGEGFVGAVACSVTALNAGKDITGIGLELDLPRPTQISVGPYEREYLATQWMLERQISQRVVWPEELAWAEDFHTRPKPYTESETLLLINESIMRVPVEPKEKVLFPRLYDGQLYRQDRSLRAQYPELITDLYKHTPLTGNTILQELAHGPLIAALGSADGPVENYAILGGDTGTVVCYNPIDGYLLYDTPDEIAAAVMPYTPLITLEQ
ncbi:MAG TPA: hypothetical protein VJP80_08240 [Candidatus Saccharimonadales bacterium]|nr:hypothetical protein [Candidatus Saccharimonadales bacterium]